MASSAQNHVGARMVLEVFNDFVRRVTLEKNLLGRIGFPADSFFCGIENLAAVVFLLLLKVAGPYATDNQPLPLNPETRSVA